MALQEFTDQTFEAEVLQNPKLVMVDFHAPWCGPCQQLNPIVEKVADEYGDKPVSIGKLNVDESNQTAGTYGVMSIPTIILFKDGKEVEQLRGMQSEVALKEKIDALIA